MVTTRHLYTHNHTRKSDDINPVWLNDTRRVVVFERDNKVRHTQDVVYLVQFPGLERGQYKKPFEVYISSAREEGKMAPFDTGPRDYRSYAGYFSWAPDNSQRFVFIQNHKTLVLGQISGSEGGRSRRVDWIKLQVNNIRTAWSVNDEIVFVSEFSGNGDLYLAKAPPLSLKITEQSLENLKPEGVPDDVLKKLKSIENQEIIGKEKFVGTLKTTIGDEQTEEFKSLILERANKSLILERAKDPPKLQLTSSEALDTEPNWSPDGRRLVYTSNHTGSKHIYLIEDVAQVLSSGPVETGKRLLDRETEEANPVWSPDGSKIAFYTMTEESGESVNLWVMNSDGANPLRLDTNVKRNAKRGPSWIQQKDLGDKIVYVSLTRTGDFIYVVDVNTREKRRVETGTEMNKNVSCAPGEYPYIAFSAHDKAGRMRIYIKELEF